MKYKAKITFGGVVSMAEGEVKEVDERTAKELLKAGYIEEIKPATKKADTKKKGAK